MKKIRVISIISTICIMALIFFFSSQTREESSEVSRGFVETIVSVLFKNSSEYEKKSIVEMVHSLVRTAAHFTMFGLLGLSAMTMFCLNMHRGKVKISSMALLFCFLYACSDEIHQIFVPGRAFQVFDIFIDTLGSATGIGIIALLKKKIVG